jgi:phosphate transport system permease protein
MSLLLISILLALMVLAYVVGRRTALRVSSDDPRSLHSRPTYHGYYVALWCGLPALALVLIWVAAQPGVVDSMVLAEAPASVHALPPERVDLFLRDARSLASGGVASRAATPELEAAAARYAGLDSLGRNALAASALALAVAGLAWARRRVSPEFRARNSVERSLNTFLIACSTVAIVTTIGIVLSLIFEALRFFALVSPMEFLFGTQWSPQTALRADQVGSSGAFGAVPIFAGTLLITILAMAVAVPVGLMAAIYLSEYARPSARAVLKPLLEILAGIPTVVYGFFAALTVGPVIRGFGEALGLDVASESALGAGLVMGVMIIPFVSSLSDDVISAVPQAMRDGALGLGSTKSEMIKRVVLPAALHGIVGAVLLAVSRAIGETMIVVMAAGLAANLTGNPLEAVTTVTVQIVTLLVGDQEFDSAKTLAAFALGLVLFFVTLVLNVIALRVVRKYREQYE